MSVKSVRSWAGLRWEIRLGFGGLAVCIDVVGWVPKSVDETWLSPPRGIARVPRTRCWDVSLLHRHRDDYAEWSGSIVDGCTLEGQSKDVQIELVKPECRSPAKPNTGK
jgi:hypothetical protein